MNSLAFIVAQRRLQLPPLLLHELAMIKDNIDQLLDSGMLKLDVSEKSNYELGDDLWVKSMESSLENDMMGQKSGNVVKIQLKD